MHQPLILGAYCQEMRAGGPWHRVEKLQHNTNHTHFGNEGNISAPTDIHNEDEYSCITTAGQQNSNSLYQSEGGNTLKTSLGHSIQSLELVPQKVNNITSQAHCGSEEHLSRFRI